VSNAAFNFKSAHLLHVFQLTVRKLIFAMKMQGVFELRKMFSLQSVEWGVTVSLYWLVKGNRLRVFIVRRLLLEHFYNTL